MLSSEEQRKICAEYGKRDETGHARCNQCPLCISVTWRMCHANSHYDPETCEFVLNDLGAKPSQYPDGPMYERIKEQ